jgi:hypothetical protein
VTFAEDLVEIFLLRETREERTRPLLCRREMMRCFDESDDDDDYADVDPSFEVDIVDLPPKKSTER